jgi:hypothetical protein
VPWTAGVPNVSPYKARKRRINDQKGKDGKQEHNQIRRNKGHIEEIHLAIGNKDNLHKKQSRKNENTGKTNEVQKGKDSMQTHDRRRHKGAKEKIRLEIGNKEYLHTKQRRKRKVNTQKRRMKYR